MRGPAGPRGDRPSRVATGPGFPPRRLARAGREGVAS